MTPKTIRSFAAGLFVAACVTGVVYYAQSDQTTSANELSEDELSAALVDAGYKVEKKEKWEALEADLKETEKNLEETKTALEEAGKSDKEKKDDGKKKDTDKNDGDKKDDKKKDEEPVHKTVIKVEPGMTNIDVAEELADAKIIDKPSDYWKKVEKEGLESDLKPQKTEVSSDMSLDEIIDAFFKE